MAAPFVRGPQRHPRPVRRPFRPGLETLESRLAPAAVLSAGFDAASGVLRVEGTEGPDFIRVRRDGTQLKVLNADGSAVGISVTGGPVASLALTAVKLIEIDALGGND